MVEVLPQATAFGVKESGVNIFREFRSLYKMSISHDHVLFNNWVLRKTKKSRLDVRSSPLPPLSQPYSTFVFRVS